jgi:hypothetical protein
MHDQLRATSLVEDDAGGPDCERRKRAARRRRQGTVQVWVKCGERRDEVIVGVANNDHEIGTTELTTNHRHHLHFESCSRGAARSFERKLEIVRDLVLLNFGELEAKCTGEGTAFWFGLPVVDQTEIAARYLKQRSARPSNHSTVSFVKVLAPGRITGNLHRDTNSFLGLLLRPNDLICQVEHGLWLITFSRKCPDLPRSLRRVEGMRETVKRQRLRESLRAIVAEPLGTSRAADRAGPILETINVSFEAESATKKENPT